MKTYADLSAFPGGTLVAKGLSDVQKGIVSQEALLVQIAQSRLEALGFKLDPHKVPGQSSEHRLYAVLRETRGAGAHSAYNALIRKLVSFVRAYRLAARKGTQNQGSECDTAKSNGSVTRPADAATSAADRSERPTP